MEWIAALLTLTAMEVVLGIDNIIFLTLVVAKLPAAQQPHARRLGLTLALALRLLLLLTISWIMSLIHPLFTLADIGIPESWTGKAIEISGKSLILIGGGLFLMGKAVLEIHGKLEGGHNE